MAVRGTRNLFGVEAEEHAQMESLFFEQAKEWGYQRFIPSSLAEAILFAGQIGDNRTFEFADHAGRPLVLAPEITAIVRQEYRESWQKTLPKPVKVFYSARCYRYDRPQRGRYREFTQMGIEILGGSLIDDIGPTNVRECLKAFLGDLKYEWRPLVKRGLAYYVEDGFEVWANDLQIAGGGRYTEGIGWAIGLERLLLVKNEQRENNDKQTV